MIYNLFLYSRVEKEKEEEENLLNNNIYHIFYAIIFLSYVLNDE